MGQCISTPDQHPAVAEQPKKAQRVGQYLEDGANRCIVEGLSQAYRIVKLLGSGARSAAFQVACPVLQPASCTWLHHTPWLLTHYAWAHSYHLAGAEASTWLVQDIQTNKPWAIKLIQLPIAARFVQAIFRYAPPLAHLPSLPHMCPYLCLSRTCSL